MRTQFSALVFSFLALLSSAAHAAPIEYVFDGTGTGTLNGTSFSGPFSITMIADTVSIAPSGPGYLANFTTDTFNSGSLNANLLNFTNIVLNTSSSFPSIGFEQNQPAPVYAVNEAVVNPAFESYNLMTAFPLTSGTVSFLPQTYLTNVGNLSFTSISSLAFEASPITPSTPSAVPLPSSFPLFLCALLGAGFIAKRRSAKTVVA